jgi:hypothetical protein
MELNLRILTSLLLVTSVYVTANQAPKVQQISLDGVNLEYFDIGEGNYTLIVESGIGMGVSYWNSFIPLASALEDWLIVYSRAGNGAPLINMVRNDI